MGPLGRWRAGEEDATLSDGRSNDRGQGPASIGWNRSKVTIRHLRNARGQTCVSIGYGDKLSCFLWKIACRDTIAILRSLHREAKASHNHHRASGFAIKLSDALLAADEAAESEQLFGEALREAAARGPLPVNSRRRFRDWSAAKEFSTQRRNGPALATTSYPT